MELIEVGVGPVQLSRVPVSEKALVSAGSVVDEMGKIHFDRPFVLARLSRQPFVPRLNFCSINRTFTDEGVFGDWQVVPSWHQKFGLESDVFLLELSYFILVELYIFLHVRGVRYGVWILIGDYLIIIEDWIEGGVIIIFELII